MTDTQVCDKEDEREREGAHEREREEENIDRHNVRSCEKPGGPNFVEIASYGSSSGIMKWLLGQRLPLVLLSSCGSCTSLPGFSLVLDSSPRMS